MGTDIYCQAERYVNGQWRRIDGVKPFRWRDYHVCGFLAGQRHYSVPPISKPRGLPVDADYVEPQDGGHWLGEHSFSWLSMDELTSFDYDKEFDDTDIPSGSRKTTYRIFLGPKFFDELGKLRELGAERIVFGFHS